MVRKATMADAAAVAGIHFESLNSGFLPKLGIQFLTSLYRFLIEKEIVLVFAQSGKLEGFISGATRSNGLMKRLVLFSPGIIFKVMLIMLQKPQLIVKILESALAPSKYPNNNNTHFLPGAELLSIAIDETAQNTGAGSQLIFEFERHLKLNGIQAYKVVAGASLAGANKFYQKHGFTLVSQIEIHGDDLSNLYTKRLN
jgi:ribosomal protein S18 acetylase RimI-like enzyme